MTDLAGQKWGKYELVERLGRSNVLETYKAYQPGLDRHVAIKVIPSHLTKFSDFVEHFRRKARNIAELHHTNIVQVIDFDVHEGNYYIVMDFIACVEPLRDHLSKLASKSELMALDDALKIVSKLADALDYSHKKIGLNHGNINPTNVLILSIDRPLLSDFGFVDLLSEILEDPRMVRMPAYMSPEHGLGNQGDVQSDIYSLGVLLYEMLTGQPPYSADTSYGVILKHINDPLTPPRKFVDSIPDLVDRIILKSLAKKPDQRYQTASEMRDALHKAAREVILAAMPAYDSTKPAPQNEFRFAPPPSKPSTKRLRHILIEDEEGNNLINALGFPRDITIGELIKYLKEEANISKQITITLTLKGQKKKLEPELPLIKTGLKDGDTLVASFEPIKKKRSTKEWILHPGVIAAIVAAIATIVAAIIGSK